MHLVVESLLWEVPIFFTDRCSTHSCGLVCAPQDEVSSAVVAALPPLSFSLLLVAFKLFFVLAIGLSNFDWCIFIFYRSML